jgi:hypothetical protein
MLVVRPHLEGQLGRVDSKGWAFVQEPRLTGLADWASMTSRLLRPTIPAHWRPSRSPKLGGSTSAAVRRRQHRHAEPGRRCPPGLETCPARLADRQFALVGPGRFTAVEWWNRRAMKRCIFLPVGLAVVVGFYVWSKRDSDTAAVIRHCQWPMSSRPGQSTSTMRASAWALAWGRDCDLDGARPVERGAK